MFSVSIRKLAWSVAVCLCWAVCSLAEAADNVRVEKDIAYVTEGDVSQKLDLYLPAQPADKPLPLIIWVHGGGWQGHLIGVDGVTGGFNCFDDAPI